MQLDRNEVVAPKMTNREAAAVISSMRAIAPIANDAFALWYQYAALAYGWDPDTDRLDLSSAQADRVYPADAAVELQLAMQRLTGELDDRAIPDPRLELDKGTFDDRIFQAEIAAALRQDGASTQAVIPHCRDQKTGKARLPRVKCDPNDPDGTARRKRKVLEPNTRQIVEVDCDAPGDCKPIDPLGGFRSLGRLAMVVLVVGGALYLFAPAALSGAIAGRGNKPRRGRRRRY